MRTARRPAVAGSFYPADPAPLAATVDELLGPESEFRASTPPPQAVVVPHAGYRCSGPVAASAYRLVRQHRANIRTAVVLGPAHFRDIGGMAVPRCSAWSTPLGKVPVDVDLSARLVDAGLVRADDAAHSDEHSIEVQLPFLQRALAPSEHCGAGTVAGWSFLPVAVRSAAPETVADCIDEVAGDGVLLLVSSDLSHYHEETTAVALDRRTAQAILDRDVDGVRDRDACGAEAVRGLLAWARRHDLAVELLGLGTSADTCTGPDRVVGYGAFAVCGRLS